MHNDYALAPVKLKISLGMLSNYFGNIPNDNEIKIGNVNELVPNLGNKSKYVSKKKEKFNIEIFISLGTKLTKVNRI